MITIESHGHKLHFHVRDTEGGTDLVVLREAFEENVYDLHEDHFNRSGIMIDIGANIGAQSIFACVLGARKVIAFEPEPENFRLLRRHISMNGLPIRSHQIAVWSSAKMISLFPNEGNTTSSSKVVEAHPTEVIQVQTMTLEQVLAPYTEVDVLKVDTEGAEYKIFKDRDVNHKARKIVVEYHTTTTEKFGALLALLSLTHNIRVFGHYDTDGGQIFGDRYG